MSSALSRTNQLWHPLIQNVTPVLPQVLILRASDGREWRDCNALTHEYSVRNSDIAVSTEIYPSSSWEGRTCRFYVHDRA
jgi:DNA-binding transcriptional regulator PaaX